MQGVSIKKNTLVSNHKTIFTTALAVTLGSLYFVWKEGKKGLALECLVHKNTAVYIYIPKSTVDFINNCVHISVRISLENLILFFDFLKNLLYIHRFFAVSAFCLLLSSCMSVIYLSAPFIDSLSLFTFA